MAGPDLSWKVAIVRGGGRCMGLVMVLALARARTMGVMVTSVELPDETKDAVCRRVYGPEAAGALVAWLASGESVAHSGCRFNSAQWYILPPAAETSEVA